MNRPVNRPMDRPLYATPEDAERAFYDALRQGDVHLMTTVWSDEDDVVCIRADGMRAVGYDAVLKLWSSVLRSGPVLLQPQQTTVLHGLMSVIHIHIEQGAHATGLQAGLARHATNVFHKGPTGWRMVLHHASPAPHQTDVLDLQGRLDTLH